MDAYAKWLKKQLVSGYVVAWMIMWSGQAYPIYNLTAPAGILSLPPPPPILLLHCDPLSFKPQASAPEGEEGWDGVIDVGELAEAAGGP